MPLLTHWNAIAFVWNDGNGEITNEAHSLLHNSTTVQQHGFSFVVIDFSSCYIQSFSVLRWISSASVSPVLYFNLNIWQDHAFVSAAPRNDFRHATQVIRCYTKLHRNGGILRATVKQNVIIATITCFPFSCIIFSRRFAFKLRIDRHHVMTYQNECLFARSKTAMRAQEHETIRA